jgi:diguanylate cyclase (GGDEF)-like protein
VDTQVTADYAALVAQAVGALLLGVLLLGFHRHYRKGYLLHWAWSWLCFCAYVAGTAATSVLASRLGPAHPAALVPAVVSGIAGYLQLAFLIFGAYELEAGRPPRRLPRWLIPALAVAGLSSSVLFVTDPDAGAWRYFARVGLRSLVASAALVVAGLRVWESRLDEGEMGIPRLGPKLVGVGCFAYGLAQLQYVVLAAVSLQWMRMPTPLVHLGWLDFILQWVMGLGMVVCLLEEERRTAVRASAQIEHLAYYDGLTGLPNRELFIDRLGLALVQAHRDSRKLAVLFLDLDRFKLINDSLGHSVGDELLRAMGKRVHAVVREGDTVARLGGDEFTLLLPGVHNASEAARVAHKLLEAVRAPFQLQGREVYVTTSIGISLYPDDGLDAESLIRNADIAMYRAKEQGRDRFQLYAPAMNAQAEERLGLEHGLRKALAQEQLVLHYQPIIEVATGRIHGTEALLRWRHPDLGLVPPDDFIELAEMTGLITPMGPWILEEACARTRAWQRGTRYYFSVAVNLSARQFLERDLVAQVKRALRRSGLEGRYLELEITESVAMQGAENTLRTLTELKALGVRISIDDFGTGYSSLAYLKRFPIDTLKIDHSFVSDIGIDANDAAIASAVIAMAHGLGLRVVAEGVEREEQLDFLRRQRCDHYQGYLFSRPLAADEFHALLRDGPRGPDAPAGPRRLPDR